MGDSDDGFVGSHYSGSTDSDGALGGRRVRLRQGPRPSPLRFRAVLASGAADDADPRGCESIAGNGRCYSHVYGAFALAVITWAIAVRPAGYATTWSRTIAEGVQRRAFPAYIDYVIEEIAYAADPAVGITPHEAYTVRHFKQLILILILIILILLLI